MSPDNTREIPEGSTFSNFREVIMTMSEYEERFRLPAPSLHQPSRRSGDPTGEEGGADAFGLRLPSSVS